MRKTCGVLAVAVLIAMTGCTPSMQQVWDNFQTKVDNIDWSAKAAWFDGAVKGLDTTARLVEKFKPEYAPEIETARQALASAQTAVDAFAVSATAYKAGTLTETTVEAKADEVNAAYLKAWQAVEDLQAPAAVPTQ